MWSEEIVADGHDTDAQGYIRPACILRYLQTAANGQMKNLGPSNEELWAQGRAFLVSRVLLVFHRPIQAYERLVASSFGCGGKGLRFLRCGRVTCGDEVVAEMSSVWAFVESDTRKLLPVSEFQPNFAMEAPILTDESLRVTIPRDLTLTELGTHTVRYRDVDRNGHMNNTIYPDVLMGFLPGIETCRITRLALCFFGEAKLGTTFTVYGAQTETGWLVRTVRADGSVGVEAEFTCASHTSEPGE